MKIYNTHLLPKHHFITHYPMIIQKMGPVRASWTMRFEGKHQFFKDLARKLKNYKDICYSFSVRHQQHMLYAWNNTISLDSPPLLKNFKSEYLKTNNYCELISNHIKLSEETLIFSGKNIFYRGVTLTVNKLLCIGFTNKLPIFAKALSFFSFNNRTYAVCQPYKSLRVSKDHVGYDISVQTDSLSVIDVTTVPYCKSLEVYDSYGHQCIITEYFLYPKY
jgi:hypothetical protein